MCCLGWIAAALLLGYIWGKWHRRPGMLRERCAEIVSFRGRRLPEVMALLGGPAQDVHTLPDGQTWRTWRECGYAITLRFDAQDVCQGVYDEQG